MTKLHRTLRVPTSWIFCLFDACAKWQPELLSSTQPWQEGLPDGPCAALPQGRLRAIGAFANLKHLQLREMYADEALSALLERLTSLQVAVVAMCHEKATRSIILQACSA